jgi:hypothetical protein
MRREQVEALLRWEMRNKNREIAELRAECERLRSMTKTDEKKPQTGKTFPNGRAGA